MHEIAELSRKQLRDFGLLMGGLIAGLFGLFLPWLFERTIPWWPWAIGGVFLVWAIAAPGSLKPVYHGWMRLGLAISKVTTPLILGLVYYLLFFPAGLIMRIFGHDPMKRKLDGAATSYRTPSKSREPTNVERPF